jgi:hypothetical protein
MQKRRRCRISLHLPESLYPLESEWKTGLWPARWGRSRASDSEKVSENFTVGVPKLLGHTATDAFASFPRQKIYRIQHVLERCQNHSPRTRLPWKITQLTCFSMANSVADIRAASYPLQETQ